ncbi:MAG TPA: aminotransferase class IV [bacterium]|nr:aminotransferase class IV [bacterium]
MLSRRKVWMDGKLVPFSKAQVHILSHSFCRGSAVFEVMSVHPTPRGPAVFRLDEHVARLARSAELVHMKLPLSARALKQAVAETVAANKIGMGMAKLICYYGGVEFEVVPRDPAVSVFVAAVDLARDVNAERFNQYERSPASVTIARWRRLDPRTVPLESKCAANYLGGMVAKLEAIKQGFTAPVLLDLDGNLAEGATESLFLVKDRVLKTPPLGKILSGITRKSILQVARDIGITTVEKKLKPAELMDADEAFFTSSIVKTWPIARVNGKSLKAPGEITRLLDKVMDKVVTGKVRRYNKWLFPVK